MKYLTTMLDDSLIEDFKDDYLLIKQNFKEKGIDFNDTEEYVFSNHIVCLLKRLKSGELIDPIDEEMMKEIDYDVFDLTEKCIEPIFKKYNLEISRSEVFLVATHIQMNKIRKEEKK